MLEAWQSMLDHIASPHQDISAAPGELASLHAAAKRHMDALSEHATTIDSAASSKVSTRSIPVAEPLGDARDFICFHRSVAAFPCFCCPAPSHCLHLRVASRPDALPSTILSLVVNTEGATTRISSNAQEERRAHGKGQKISSPPLSSSALLCPYQGKLSCVPGASRHRPSTHRPRWRRNISRRARFVLIPVRGGLCRYKRGRCSSRL